MERRLVAGSGGSAESDPRGGVTNTGSFLVLGDVVLGSGFRVRLTQQA